MEFFPFFHLIGGTEAESGAVLVGIGGGFLGFFFVITKRDGRWMMDDQGDIYVLYIYIYIYLCQRQRELGFLSFFFGLYVDRIFFHGMDVRQSSQPSRGGGIIIYSRMLLKFD